MDHGHRPHAGYTVTVLPRTPAYAHQCDDAGWRAQIAQICPITVNAITPSRRAERRFVIAVRVTFG
jgi:hypothetical protein